MIFSGIYHNSILKLDEQDGEIIQILSTETLRKWCAKLTGKRFDFTLDKEKIARSGKHSSYHWVCSHHLAIQTGNAVDTIRREAKDRAGLFRIVKIGNREQKEYVSDSGAGMSKEQMHLMMMGLEMIAADCCIQLPPPKEKYSRAVGIEAMQ